MADMTREVLEANAAKSGIPDYMRDGLIAHILDGRPTGGFLTALLSNDLKETFNKADDVNQKVVYNYVFFLFNYAPRAAWGSPERVERWRKDGGYNGLIAKIEQSPWEKTL